MTSAGFLQIGCFYEGKIAPYLNAIVIDQLDFNILTKAGFEALRGIKVRSREKRKSFHDRNGVEHFVRDVVQLQIFSSRSAKSATREFYVLLGDQEALDHPNLHVILSPAYFPWSTLDPDCDPVTVIKVPPPKKDAQLEYEAEEEKQRKVLEQRDRERRDKDKALNEQSRSGLKR